jgi:hypothetical protein
MEGDSDGEVKAKAIYTPEEETKLAEIAGEKEGLKVKRMMLGIRRFLGMVKERAKGLRRRRVLRSLWI